MEEVLEQLEEQLRSSLLTLLPSGVDRGVDYFTNGEFSQVEGNRRWNPDAERLLELARECAVSRSNLGLPDEGTLARSYLEACRELASGGPHRRGPRRLAEWLLAEARAKRSNISFQQTLDLSARTLPRLAGHVKRR